MTSCRIFLPINLLFMIFGNLSLIFDIYRKRFCGRQDKKQIFHTIQAIIFKDRISYIILGRPVPTPVFAQKSIISHNTYGGSPGRPDRFFYDVGLFQHLLPGSEIPQHQ